MRRTLLLAAFVTVAAVLAATVEPPRRLSGPEQVHGPRVVRARPADVRRIELDVAGRRLAADRAGGGGWRLDAGDASPALAEAIDALVGELAGLRAVDAFPAADVASLGLDPPAATIGLGTARGVQRIAFGNLNAVGSTVYARCDDHGRVLQVGVYVVELVRRIFEVRDREGRSASIDPRLRRDEVEREHVAVVVRATGIPAVRTTDATRSRPISAHDAVLGRRIYRPEMG